METDPDSDVNVTFEPVEKLITTVDELKLRFNKPLIPRGGEKYWVTIVPPGPEQAEQPE